MGGRAQICFHGSLGSNEKQRIRDVIETVETGCALDELPPQFGAPWLVLAEGSSEDRILLASRLGEIWPIRAGSVEGLAAKIHSTFQHAERT